jgi:hypothetical protein
MNSLMRVAVLIELVGMLVMLALTLKFLLAFIRRREGALKAGLGPLLMSIGLAFLLARRLYFRSASVIPLSAATPALIIGLAVSGLGFFMVVRDWKRTRRGG